MKNIDYYDKITHRYLYEVKKGARRRAIYFDLNTEDVWNKYLLQEDRCILSGQNIYFVKNYKKNYLYQTASIDRIDSKLGYTKDNIQIVHKDINRMKWYLPDSEFLYWVDLVTSPMKNLNTDQIYINKSKDRAKKCGNMYQSHYNTIVRCANKKNIYVYISIEDCWDLFLNQNGRCAITNIPLNFPTKYDSNDGTASLDRINSKLDYSLDNIQWVHKTINIMKLDYSMKKFRRICRQIYEHKILKI